MEYQLKVEGKFKYIDEGQGEIIVLLHGLFGALSNWRSVIEHFSSRYRIVIPLMPIYEMPILSTSAEGLADFIYEFIKYKGFGKVTLLGNSLGGHVALIYTKKHMEMVKCLALTGSSGLYENAMGGSFPKRGDYEYIKKKVEYTFYAPETATKELVDEVYSITNDRNKILRILSMAKSAIRHNMRKDIPKFTIPTCLIWGLNDRVTPPEVGEEFHTLFPDSELHFLDKCGHAPMMEQPEEFNKILDAFLNRIYPPSK
ncbi:MAG: alpha/beta hydrolase [Bacteroidia bacterium]|nr:alpha/beta hydrolase [Bacteroidia bacterium]